MRATSLLLVGVLACQTPPADDTLTDAERATITQEVTAQLDSVLALAQRKDADAFSRIVSRSPAGVLIDNGVRYPSPQAAVDAYRAAWSIGGRQDMREVEKSVHPVSRTAAVSYLAALIAEVDSTGVRTPPVQDVALFVWVRDAEGWKLHSSHQYVGPTTAPTREKN